MGIQEIRKKWSENGKVSFFFWWAFWYKHTLKSRGSKSLFCQRRSRLNGFTALCSSDSAVSLCSETSQDLSKISCFPWKHKTGNVSFPQGCVTLTRGRIHSHMHVYTKPARTHRLCGLDWVRIGHGCAQGDEDVWHVLLPLCPRCCCWVSRWRQTLESRLLSLPQEQPTIL